MKYYTPETLPDLALDPPEDEPRPSESREPPDGWPTDEEYDAAGDDYEAKIERQADAREVFLARLSKWGRCEP